MIRFLSFLLFCATAFGAPADKTLIVPIWSTADGKAVQTPFNVAGNNGKVLGISGGTWALITGGSGSSSWGGITGTLTDQTDLTTALGTKAPLASPVFTGTSTVPLQSAIPAGANIICVGDSITAGTVGLSAGQDWPSQVMAMSSFTGRGCTKYNFAVAGWSWDNLATDYNTHVKPLRPAVTGVPAILYVWCGTNNLINSDSAILTESKASSYCTTARADGFTLIFLSTMHRGGETNAIYTEYNTYNSLTRAATYYDSYVDMAMFFPDYLDTNIFQSDQIHPTASGEFAIASILNAYAQLGRYPAPFTLTAVNSKYLRGYSVNATFLANFNSSAGSATVNIGGANSNGNLFIHANETGSNDMSGFTLWPRLTGANSASRPWAIKVNNNAFGALEFFGSSSATAAPATIRASLTNSGLNVVDTVTAALFSGSGASLTNLPAGNLSGAVPIANGGTAATTASAARTNLGLVIGTDVLAPSGNAATATALATPRAIYGNNFDGSAALAQIIASTYGGTGNGFTKFSGPATSEKTFTLPNASATILTDNAAVTVAQGGTGRATGTTAYGLIAAGTTATGAQQTLPAGNTTEVLMGGGSSALPIWTLATGSGSPVLSNSPALVTPALGTPSSGTLTNCTGLPLSGLSGTGTGVAAALAIAPNTAGGFSKVSPTATLASVTSGGTSTLAANTEYTGAIDTRTIALPTASSNARAVITYQGTAAASTTLTWGSNIVREAGGSGYASTTTFSSGNVTANWYCDGTDWWLFGSNGSAGSGDASTNTSTSVDSEVALFSGTGGKTLKRATGTGIARLASGVQSAAELSGDVSTSGSNVVTIGAGKVTEAMQVLANNTTGNVSTSKHGYAPILPNDATKYLDGTGAYSTPAGGGSLHSITFVVDGAGSAVTTGVKIPVKTPYGGTLTGYTMMCSPSGSITFNIFRAADGAGLPTASIINNAGGGSGSGTLPAIASGVEGKSTTFTSWGSTTITAFDNLALNLTTVDGTVTKCTLVLYYQ